MRVHPKDTSGGKRMDSKKKTAVGRRFDESEAQAKLSRIVSKNFSLCDIRLLHNRCTSQKQSTRLRCPGSLLAKYRFARVELKQEM